MSASSAFPISALSSKIKSIPTQTQFISIAYLKWFQAIFILVFLNLATLERVTVQLECIMFCGKNEKLYSESPSSASYLGHDVSIAHVQVILLKFTVHTHNKSEPDELRFVPFIVFRHEPNAKTKIIIRYVFHISTNLITQWEITELGINIYFLVQSKIYW